MKKLIALFAFSFITSWSMGQTTNTMDDGTPRRGLTQPPSGDNQKAKVIQGIGPVQISIAYSSPRVHGPNGTDRKGHIWGELVAYGFTDLGFGSSKASPWRAGANENTVITFANDVKVEGKDLKAGSYGLFLALEEDGPWTWIFSKNTSSWGSFFYNQKEDALRVTVMPQDAAYTEYLTYGFDDRKPGSAVAYLQWENKRIPFTIEVPDVNTLYFLKMRDELRSSTGFDYQNWVAAAQFCAQNKINLDEALTWADAAISLPFVGQENFNSLQAKAQVLQAIGRDAEADVAMNKAIRQPTANTQNIHQYGGFLLTTGKKERALEIFQYNAKTHPEDKFTPNIGLARGYSAMGDKKNAIKYWEIALQNIPENQKAREAFYNGELQKVRDMK